MSTPDERVVEKGSREPTIGLAQQAEYSSALYDAYKTDLNRNGFADAKATKMRALLGTVKSAMGTQKQGWDEAHAKTRDEVMAGQAARNLISKLVKAVPMALRDYSVTSLTEADFRVGDLQHSTPKIVGYIDRVLPHVLTLEEALRPYFGGESPTQLFQNAKAGLEKADQTQELSRSQAPDATVALNRSKGQLLDLIEDLNRVGAIAFQGHADIIGKFNKDILLRARHSKSGKAEPTPAPAATSTPATPAKPS